jgi:ABC-type bacteriocin/lantibiotic exporter with double-glycine peptidase domain
MSGWVATLGSAVCLVSATATHGGQFRDEREALQGAELWAHEHQLCGPICLYLACTSFGMHERSVNDLAEMATFELNGCTISGMKRACKQLGLWAYARRLDATRLSLILRREPVRALLASKRGHFCYVDDVRDGTFRVTRYPRRPEWLTPRQLEDLWTGDALLVSQSPIPGSLLEDESRALTILWALAIAFVAVGLLTAAGSAWRSMRARRGEAT